MIISKVKSLIKVEKVQQNLITASPCISLINYLVTAVQWLRLYSLNESVFFKKNCLWKGVDPPGLKNEFEINVFDVL